jgi:lipoate-protein ligase A
MPKPKSDQLTADHQPQAAILQAAAKMDFFKSSGEMQDRADDRAAEGYAINLHHKRHTPGRTFGSKGKSTKQDFIDLVKDKVKNVTDKKKQRKAAIGVIKDHLKEDAKAIRSVVSSDAHFEDVKALGLDKETEKKLITKIKNRINEGEDQIVNQPLDPLIE